MRVIDRKQDLTRHLCADCGNVIEGPYAVRERDGVMEYVCPGRCERALADRPLRGIEFPWNREMFRRMEEVSHG